MSNVMAVQLLIQFFHLFIDQLKPGENSRHTSENGPWSTKEPQKLPTVRCPWNRKDRSTHEETATHSIKKCTAG